ncbi:hypothetical protein [Thermomonospora umbrina]|uniref:Holin n=1 Tax=Thermomonospora umbrina TaxID=111806 RepID=A0A3D9T1T2_9ACTN|nr:hypothetical protein [Thermomonospora umbrina]REF00284.1 hypothetical protein DFJ69_5813 [Thermomonospora umbrina]
MKYAKTIIATVLAAAYAVQAAITDETVTTTEWVGIVLAVLTALGVYVVPNRPTARDEVPGYRR